VYENAKMIPDETVPGIGGGRGLKESRRGMNSSMIYLIHSKNFCKSHNIPPHSTIRKKLNLSIQR
jgi:hypothetical protein